MRWVCRSRRYGAGSLLANESLNALRGWPPPLRPVQVAPTELYRADMGAARRTIAYARVSSHDQKAELERQKQVLELYCASQD